MKYKRLNEKFEEILRQIDDVRSKHIKKYKSEIKNFEDDVIKNGLDYEWYAEGMPVLMAKIVILNGSYSAFERVEDNKISESDAFHIINNFKNISHTYDYAFNELINWLPFLKRARNY